MYYIVFTLRSVPLRHILLIWYACGRDFFFSRQKIIKRSLSDIDLNSDILAWTYPHRQISVEVSDIDWWCIYFLSAGKDQCGNSASLAERSRYHRAFKGQEGRPDVKGHAVPE